MKGLYRRKDGKSKNYRYSVTLNGTRYQGTTGSANKRKAELIFADIIEQIEDRTWGNTSEQKAAPPSHTFEELRDRYIAERSANKSESTVLRDGYTFKQLAKTLSGLDLTAITPSKVSEHKARRIKEGIKPATLAKELQLLKTALSTAIREWEWLSATPFNKVKIEVPKNAVERWLTLEEEALLMAACPIWLGEIVSFALDTGMRRNEILSLRWPQVDLERQLATLLVTKNKEKRSVPLNNRVLGLLSTKIGVRKDSGYVFPSENGTKIDGHNVGRAFRIARDKAGVSDFRFHDLRHTAGSRMVQSGVDLYTVSLILGHKSLAMTKRYAHHNVESIRHGVDALEKWREEKIAALLLHQAV